MFLRSLRVSCFILLKQGKATHPGGAEETGKPEELLLFTAAGARGSRPEDEVSDEAAGFALNENHPSSSHPDSFLKPFFKKTFFNFFFTRKWTFSRGEQ